MTSDEVVVIFVHVLVDFERAIGNIRNADFGSNPIDPASAWLARTLAHQYYDMEVTQTYQSDRLDLAAQKRLNRGNLGYSLEAQIQAAKSPRSPSPERFGVFERAVLGSFVAFGYQFLGSWMVGQCLLSVAPLVKVVDPFLFVTCDLVQTSTLAVGLHLFWCWKVAYRHHRDLSKGKEIRSVDRIWQISRWITIAQTVLACLCLHVLLY